MKGKEKTPKDREDPLSKESSTSWIGNRDPALSIEAIRRIRPVPAILKAVSELTRMRYVVIARVTNERWIACAVLDEMDFGLGPGGELEVATTLCSEVRDHRTPIVIGHASKDTVYCNHPTPKKYGIESYIAVPITLKTGEFFGTLCAVDSRPADLSSESTLDSLRLFADLIANELGNESSYVALEESERRRRESELRIRAVTDAMPGLISYIDREYRYQFVNHAYTDWFGLKAEDIIRRPLWEVLGQAAFDDLKPHVDLALTGETEIFESEIDYKLAGRRFIRATYTPDIHEGEVRGIFVLVVDITEEKKARDAVRRSEERYKAFISHSSEGIWRFELDEPIPTDLPSAEQVRLALKRGFLAECNDAMARQYGYASAEAIVGARMSDLLVEDDPKNVEFLTNFIESGYHLSEAESHERDADGKDRYFLNNFVGIVENGFLLRAWGTQRDVTLTKLADDATARLAAIVVSSEDAIISKDLMGNITSWNVGAAKMFGYTAEEVIGQPISILMPPDRRNEAAEILRRIRREETVEHFETVRRRRDGTDIVVSLTVSPIRNAEGNVIGASKIVRDITERKQIEESIHQNQAMLTLAMQSSRMGVWELDLATGTVSWSEELEEIFGLKKGGFGGTEGHFFALMHEDDREEAWNEVRLAIAERRDYSIEFRFHHADGTVRWMEGRGEAVYSQKGEPVRLYGVGIDITSRKEAERALRESEQRFSRFMQHLPGLAWIKDIDGRYIYANESAERAFGVAGPKLYGKTDEEIFPAETAEQFRTHDRRAVESGTGIQIMESMVEDDGVLHHSIVSKFPIAGSDGATAMIGGMAIDITDQKQAEEALRKRMDFDEAVMQHMGEGLYTVDAEGLVTSLNPAGEKLFGWTFEELRGRKMHEFVHFKHRDGSPFPAEECPALNVARTGESVIDHEDVFIRRDGTFFDVLFSSSALKENDKVIGLVVVFTEITERKRAEQRVALQEEISELIRTVASPGELLYQVSASVGSHLGVKRALFNEIDLAKDLETVDRDYCAEGVPSVTGTHMVSDYSPITSGEMQAGRTIVNKDSKTDPRTAEHYERSYGPNGERSYVAVPLLRGGVWVASLWVSDDEPRDWDKQDVSLLETIAERTWAAVEKMRIDAALRESQERFAKAFSSGPLVFTLSSLRDGRLVEVNQTFVEVTGFTREEAIGKTSAELGLWSSSRDRDEEMDAVRTDGHVRNLEYSFRTRTGDEIIGLLSAERIEIGGEPFALSVVQDITERKRGELNQQFLLGLTEMIREATNVNSLFAAVAEMLGDHLNAERCLFNEIDHRNEIAVVLHEYKTNPDAPTFVGSIKIDAFVPAIREALVAGETISVQDAASDPRTAHDYASRFEGNDARSFIAVPLMRDSVWQGTLWVSREDTHSWPEWEIDIIQTVAERSWLAAEKLRSEKSLRDSEAQYRDLANAMPQLVWTAGVDGRVDYYNSLAQTRYNISFNDDLGEWDWHRIVHPSDSGATEAAWQSAQQTGYYEVEHRIKIADGTYRWHLSKASPVWDDSHVKIVKWFGTATDIHDYRFTQEALIKAERKATEEYQALLGRIVPLAATLGRARDLTTIYRAVRDFIKASMPCSGFFVSFYDAETSTRQAAYVWGDDVEVDISELPPMPLMESGGGANSRAVFEKRTIVTNNYWDEMKKKPHVIVRENGRDPMSSLIVPMIIKDKVLGTLEVQAYENEAFQPDHAVALEMAGNLAAVAIENVRLIETENAMREAAEAANRAKDEFLSVLSHELRTPLNAMLGWVRMLKAGVLDQENSERALEVIERNTRLQSSLIEDLLDVSRIISGKMRIETELVDLVSVVETVSETIRPLAEAKEISYTFSCADEAVFLTADSVRMQQVVSNLLQNSIKFTPSGGSVSVHIARTESDATLSIEDTGVGIEAELLPFIFDRFRQADASARRNFTGLGLGLTIVRNIVELHGGTVDVSSPGKDQGSTFTLTFPLAADFYDGLQLTEDLETGSDGSLAGKSILLVDDDPENLMPLKIFLENERAEVTGAASASEAMRHLATRDFHVMITDIGMPDIDGYQLVEKLRSDAHGRNANLKAIAVTAYASIDDRERALASGFHAHFAKPINFEELLTTIERISRNGENVI